MLPSPSRLRARPPDLLTFEATYAFARATAWQFAIILPMTLSIGFKVSVSLHFAIQATRLLIIASAGHPC
jgi:hypothetical protein